MLFGMVDDLECSEDNIERHGKGQWRIGVPGVGEHGMHSKAAGERGRSRVLCDGLAVSANKPGG